ncbi:hypothetical protein DFH01_10645 [Falsiroseomonas bella]|uniref:Lipoprotein n=1 Tax=Falsiroseomonas bella TaxID=2184016 RepID=A0A317FE03_9PROT|nr:hypothetical protein [Falsiroseomonas bella]PWS37301.1 hypothetical protein DFH01_10645 [Falsiroseomonas bella]
MARTAALFGLVLLAGGCAQQGGGIAEGLSGRPSLEAAAARLPATVAGFARGDAVWHERARPGQGVAVDYAGPSRAAVATVSLYDRAQGPVSSQPGDPRVAQEFSNAVAEVLAQADRRTSQIMAERGRSQLAVPGGAPLSCARLEGTYGRQQVGTLVCLGAAAGRFLKVQVTSPARPLLPVDPEPFVIGIAQAARG